MRRSRNRGLGVLLIAPCLLLQAAVVRGQEFGIDVRAANTALRIHDLPADRPGAYRLERVFPSLSFEDAVLLQEAPDGSGRLFVVEQRGTIQVFDPADPSSASVFLDIQNRVRNLGEQGLLGMAFDPDYAVNGRFYVYYSNEESGCTTCPIRISRFTNPDPADNRAEASTEETILEVPQPYGNHNGGMIAFGPDGMLYAGLGDGGSAGDPLNSGQDTTTLLGSILRLDVRSAPDPGRAYRIPRDNPFYGGGPAGAATRREIFAYGLRNPWRFCFDVLHGDLYCADVGQAAWEEVNVIAAGGNYGWRFREGAHCYNPSTGCPTEGLIDPIAEYGRSEGRSVTGGYVSAAAALPDLYGRYLYADYVTGRIWALGWDGMTVTGPDVLVEAAGFGIAGFGQDSSGEVYVLEYARRGGVYVLRPETPPSSSDFPLRLSDRPALLAASSGIDQTTAGILPYRPSTELWSDGARKERFLALPGLKRAAFRMSGGWDFPEETVLVKSFLLPLDDRDPAGTLTRIETQLLYRKNGQWWGFSYEWDDAGTDARLLTGGKDRGFARTDAEGTPYAFTWRYPSRAECLQCHTTAANGVLGLQTPAMNHGFAYPASAVTDNQLRTLSHIGFFAEPLPASPGDLPRMPDASDPSEPLEDRARAYLAMNCAMCHQPSGPAPTNLDLRWETATSAMNALGVAPQNGDLGMGGARIIDRGNAANSVLPLRMDQRGPGDAMPPLATSLVDREAVDLLNAWIDSLEAARAHWLVR